MAPAVQAAGVLLVYGRVGSKLSLYGLDPTDGSILWAQPAGYGVQYRTDDDALAVYAQDGRVGYLRPDKSEPRRSRLIVADAKTGKDLVRSAAQYFTNDISGCGSKRPAVCVTGYRVDSPSDLVSLQLNEKTGSLTDRGGGTTSGLQPMSSGEVYIGNPDDPRIIRRLNGKTLWAKKLSEFTDIGRWRGRSSLVSSKDTLTLTLTMSTPVATGIRVNYPADAVTVGIDRATGGLRWKDGGTFNACAGSMPAGPSLLRCRITGTVTDTTSGDPATVPTAAGTKLKVALEAYDPRFGKTRWSAPVGNVPTLALYGNQALVPDGPDTVLLARDSKPLLIDLRTGRATPAPADRVFWCPDNTPTHRTVPVALGGQQFTDVLSRGWVLPCDATGRRSNAAVAELPTTAGDAMSDERGDFLVVTSHSDVTAYLEPDASEPKPVATNGSGTESTRATTPVPASPVGPPHSAPEKVAWKNTQFAPVTQPRIVEGVAVYYAQDASNTLYLVAVNPATGKQLWHKWATTADLNLDRALTISSYHNQVVYWKPAKVGSGGYPATTMLVDPSTGHERPISDARKWSLMPTVCPRKPKLLCSAAFVDDTWTELRIDPATGVVSPAPKAADTADDEPDENGLLVTPTDIKRVVDKNTLWSTSRQQAFGDPDASIQLSATMDSELPMLIYTIYRNWKPDKSGDYPPFDPAKNLLTLGIDARIGKVRWRAPGMSLLCFYRIPEFTGAGPTDVKLLACTYRGILDDGDPQSGDLTRAADAKVTMMRIDPTTGKPYWSRPLGKAPDLATPDGASNVRYLDPQRLLLGTTGTVVDLNTGATRKAGAADVSWCSSDGRFTYRDPWYVDHEPQYYRTGGRVFDPCRPDGKTGAPTSIAPGIGTMAPDGTTALVAQRDGIFAYRG